MGSEVVDWRRGSAATLRPMSALSTGYRGNSDWRDMSEFAVHFTKASPTASEYEVIMKILWEGTILPAGPLGAAKNLTELGDTQKSACFS